MIVGTRQEALEADVDAARIDPGKRGVVESVLDHRARLEVFGHHVGTGGQAASHLGTLGLSQVDRNALLVAVEQREEARPRTQQMARAVAVDGFDLDRLGPQVGQHHATGRAHDHVGEFDHAQAGQRQRVGRGNGVCVHLVHAMSPWRGRSHIARRQAV